MITGKVENGTFIVPASTLIPGAAYLLTVLGAAGYQEKTVDFTHHENEDGQRTAKISLSRN